MKRLLTLLLVLISYFATAQTQPNLPPGSQIYSSNLFLAPDSSVWTGKAGIYINLGSWEKVMESIPNTWTPAQIDSAISSQIANIPPVDLSNYYDKQETDDLLDTKIDTSLLEKPNGVPLLDINGKIKMVNIPDQLVGAVNYQGTWSPATNIPALPEVPGPETKGHYYVASDSAEFNGEVYRPNDWIISSGNEWQKIEATNYVRRVNGKTGDVVITASDIGAVQTLTTPSLGQIGISGGNVVEVGGMIRRSYAWDDLVRGIVGYFNVATPGPSGSLSHHGLVIPQSGTYGTSLAFRNNRGFFQSLENGVLQPWLEIATLDKTVNLTGNQTVAGNKTWSGHQTFNNSQANFNRTVLNSAVGPRLTTNGVLRWFMYITNETESGAGGDLAIGRYSNAGSSIGTALTIARESGIVTVPNLSGTGDGLVGVTATGTLTRKAEADFKQTLSLGSTAGNIAISGGNNVSLNSLASSTVSNDLDYSFGAGFFVRSVSQSTDYPSAAGNGFRIQRNLNRGAGDFEIWKGNTSSSKLMFNRATSGTAWNGWETFASEEWANTRFLQLTGGTVSGQIKRSTDAVASDDVPRLGQVQAMIDSSTPTINLGSGLRYDSDGKIALGYDIDTGEGKITDEYFTLLKGDLQEGGYFSAIQLASFEDRIYQAAIVVADQLSGGDHNALIVSSDQILATSRIQYQGNYRSNFNSNSLVDKGYVDDLLAGTLRSGDNISELVNDVNYISAGANITLLNNNAGFVSSGTGADQVRTNADLDSRYIQSESDPTIASHIKAIAASDISNWNSKISSVIAGSGIAVDATDPYNPVISATGTALTFTGDVTGSGTGTIELTLSDDSIKTQHLADSSVTSFKIATNAVTNSKIANNAVDSAKIAANAVHTTHIEDGAVTFDKMADINRGKLMGLGGGGVNTWTSYEPSPGIYTGEWAPNYHPSPGFIVSYGNALYRVLVSPPTGTPPPPDSPAYYELVTSNWAGVFSYAKTYTANQIVTTTLTTNVYYRATATISGISPTDTPVNTPGAPEEITVGSGLTITPAGVLMTTGSPSVTGLITVGSGLAMSGIGTSANPYHITATGGSVGSSTFAGLDDVLISGIVNGQTVIYSNGSMVPADLPSPYVLPAATSSTLGGVKQGSGVSIAPDGTISATGVTPGVFTRNADGLVPAPGGSGTSRFLREDGTWGVPPGGGGSSFRLRSGSNAYLSDDVTLIAGTNVTLNQSGQNITIHASGGGSEGITALTGDVLASGTGSVAATIANAAVTNTKLANMEGNTIKGRLSSSGTPQNLTAFQTRQILNQAVLLPGTTIDAQEASKAYRSISSNITFSLINFTQGLDMQVEITNVSSGTVTVTFDNVSYPIGTDGTIGAGATAIFSITNISGSPRLTKISY